MEQEKVTDELPPVDQNNAGYCPERSGRTEPIRVLQVIDHLGLGGAQRLLQVMAEHSGPAQPVDVLVLDPDSGPVRDRLLACGGRLTELKGTQLWHPGAWLRVDRALRDAGAPTVHLHLSYATIMAAPLACWQGRRVVVSLHNAETSRILAGQRTLRSRVLGWAETLCLRYFTDLVIFVGDNVAQANLARIGRTEWLILHNVVAPVVAARPVPRAVVRSQFGVPEDAPVILSTGRLTPQKDPLTLLAAFAGVLTEIPQARLWFAGSGPLLGVLQARCADLGLNGSVIFLGDRDDIPALLDAADIFALPSAWEGLPLGLIEAMAQGRAVVATAVGDVGGVLTDGAGMLVPAGDAEALCAALTKLALDADLRGRLGEQARVAAERYTDVAGWLSQLGQAWRNDARTEA